MVLALLVAIVLINHDPSVSPFQTSGYPELARPTGNPPPSNPDIE
jgi:hypothetical protein